MDIVFSAQLKPRPQVRRQRGSFLAQFSHLPRKIQVIGTLSYPAKSQGRGDSSLLSHAHAVSAGSSVSAIDAVPKGGKPSVEAVDSGVATVLLESTASSVPEGGLPPALPQEQGTLGADCRKEVACSSKSPKLGGVWGLSLVNIATSLLSYQQCMETPKSSDGYALKKELRQWLLVLEAKEIPFLSCREGNQLRLYVPALYSRMAVAEINEYSLEGTRQASFLPSRPWWFGAACLIVCLFAWHLLRFHGFPFFSLPEPPFPSQPEQWPAAFGLDVHRTMVRGEWWRAITALTLHADGRHLLSNLLMGGAFFALLAGRIGFRRSFFLTVIGGALGNVISLLFKASAMVSIGFSTSCFALLGILGSYVFCDTAQVRLRHKEVELLHAPRWFTPLAAGLALLAFLGGAGQPNTDFTAHACGAGVGFVLGGIAWFGEQLTLGKPKLAKTIATALFLMACGMVAAAWSYGLAAFNA